VGTVFDKSKIIQVGILVKDINHAAKEWAEFLQMDMPEIFTCNKYEETGAKYNGKPCYGRIYQAIFNFENIEMELIQPMGEEPSVWKDCLDKDGEGIHHIAFRVSNMKESVEEYDKKGMPLMQDGVFPGGGYAYLDARKKLGIILEFLTFDNK
jgi:methylmalonyl-CoA/ethylmalonyl-CoA epimerase